MSRKELEFQRIARQAREFREQEEQRIAAEKEEAARRIAAGKQAERERIVRAGRESFGKAQERLEADGDDTNHTSLTFATFDSQSSKPKRGTVALRAEWLRKLEKDAAARRLLEEEFNALVAARRRNNPNESVAESEAAVKAAMVDSDRSYHSHSLNSVVEEDGEAQVGGKLNNIESRLGSDTNKEVKKMEAVIVEAGEAKKDQIVLDTKNAVEGEGIDDDPTMRSVKKKTDHVAESKRMILKAEESNSNMEIKQQQAKTELQEDFEYGADIDPRTQAMLAEDDLIPTGNNGAVDPSVSLGSGTSDFTKDRNKKKLVLENSIPVGRKSRKGKGSSRTKLDEEDDSDSDMVYKEATFELPVEVADDGLIISPDTADLNAIISIPPSRLGGRVSGRLEGTSSFGSRSNTASGSTSLEYKASKHSRLTLGMIRGCEPHHPLITIGGSLLRHGSSIGVTFYHNAKFLHQMMLEHSLWSLSFLHRFPNSNWCFSSHLSRRQDLSLSLKNGNKLSGLIGWNIHKPKKMQARIDVRPMITEYRRAHLYCQWNGLSGPGVWNFGMSLVQNLHSQIATVGLGWRLFSTRGLEWVISWSRGNATVRIPIVVSKGFAANATIGHSLYFSMVSYLIQEYIAQVWGWIGNDEDDDGDNVKNNGFLLMQAQSLTKARRDAAVQKELMARQARRKTKDEREKNGLVINKAVYQIENGEEWDVTIPLQFWVSRSTLTLTAGPKSELLGFYDIAASMENSKALLEPTDHNTDQPSRRLRRYPPWGDIWRDLLDWTPKDRSLRNGKGLPSPTLSVWYEFKGQSQQITVKDREELRLPPAV